MAKVDQTKANMLLSATKTMSLGANKNSIRILGNDSNLLIVFYVQIMPDDFVVQLHRF